MSLSDFTLRSPDDADDWEYVENDESRTPVAYSILILLVRGESEVTKFNEISLRCLRLDEEKRLIVDPGLMGAAPDLCAYRLVGLE
jgi:hypothetical protein